MDTRVLCGQLLVAGFEGPAPSARFVEALARGWRGGAILFSRNLPDVTHAWRLCASLAARAPASRPLFLAVDQEGGRVARLRSPVARLPPMRELARHGAETLRHAGDVLGAQLAAIGFNLDFAPVLDVDTNPANPVIGDRAFSSDPREAAALALAFHEGLARHVLGCGKHFPGHGDTDTDSHLALPRVTHGAARLDEIELVPFAAAARARVATLMTAHVVVDALDPGVPATLSRTIVHELLRERLGYQGVVFSDDLEMAAIAAHFDLRDAAIAAIAAGCDALLICKREELAEEVHDALVREAERSVAFRARCEEAVGRGLAARSWRPPRPGDALALRVALDRSAELEARWA
ncbi:MAG: beta-N-acetylhexosaminidase [Polyangiaceae bacterium]|nr:beta-N-acetylhexosaminidase [Polyangiaceae bacterium]